MMLAKSEAKILHEKISGKAYSDDEVVRILTTRSKPQLNATLNQYNDQFGNAITKVYTYIQNNTWGAPTSTVQCKQLIPFNETKYI